MRASTRLDTETVASNSSCDVGRLPPRLWAWPAAPFLTIEDGAQLSAASRRHSTRFEGLVSQLQAWPPAPFLTLGDAARLANVSVGASKVAQRLSLQCLGEPCAGADVGDMRSPSAESGRDMMSPDDLLREAGRLICALGPGY